MIFQELDVIENQEEYTSEEIVKAKSEIKRLQEVFDGNVKKMSEPVVKNGIKYRNKQIFIEAIQRYCCLLDLIKEILEKYMKIAH